MAMLNIALSPEAQEWIDERVRSGPYASSAEYVATLIERDRHESDEDHDEDLRRIVQDARGGGDSSLTINEIFERALDRVRIAGRLRD